MEIFSNREIALFFWLVVVAVFCCANKSTRSNLGELMTAAFPRVLVSFYILLGLYVFGIVFVLSQFGLWDISQLKNTILWTLTVALISVFSVIESQQKLATIKDLVFDNIKALAILEFVVAFYQLSLLLEIILVPIATLLVWLSAMADRKPKAKNSKIVIDLFLVLIGAGMIFHSFSQLFSDFSKFATSENFVNFYTPPLLSLFFVPFAAFMSIYASYERVFGSLMSLIQDPKVRRSAKVRAFLAFHVRTELLDRWRRSLLNHDERSVEDIRSSISEVLEMKKAEQLNAEVPPEQGWSPFDALNYLSEFGISANDYHRLIDEYFASSNTLELSGFPIANSISYYIEGNKKAATCLKLRINLNQPNEAEGDIQTFTKICNDLYIKAIGEDMPIEVIDRIALGQNTEYSSGNAKKVLVKRNDWRSHAFDGYDITLEIRRSANE